jgi:hypothetical protein
MQMQKLLSSNEGLAWRLPPHPIWLLCMMVVAILLLMEHTGCCWVHTTIVAVHPQ